MMPTYILQLFILATVVLFVSAGPLPQRYRGITYDAKFLNILNPRRSGAALTTTTPTSESTDKYSSLFGKKSQKEEDPVTRWESQGNTGRTDGNSRKSKAISSAYQGGSSPISIDDLLNYDYDYLMYFDALDFIDNIQDATKSAAKFGGESPNKTDNILEANAAQRGTEVSRTVQNESIDMSAKAETNNTAAVSSFSKSTQIADINPLENVRNAKNQEIINTLESDYTVSKENNEAVNTDTQIENAAITDDSEAKSHIHKPTTSNSKVAEVETFAENFDGKINVNDSLTHITNIPNTTNTDDMIIEKNSDGNTNVKVASIVEQELLKQKEQFPDIDTVLSATPKPIQEHRDAHVDYLLALVPESINGLEQPREFRYTTSEPRITPNETKINSRYTLNTAPQVSTINPVNSKINVISTNIPKEGTHANKNDSFLGWTSKSSVSVEVRVESVHPTGRKIASLPIIHTPQTINWNIMSVPNDTRDNNQLREVLILEVNDTPKIVTLNGDSDLRKVPANRKGFNLPYHHKYEYSTFASKPEYTTSKPTSRATTVSTTATAFITTTTTATTTSTATTTATESPTSTTASSTTTQASQSRAPRTRQARTYRRKSNLQQRRALYKNFVPPYFYSQLGKNPHGSHPRGISPFGLHPEGKTPFGSTPGGVSPLGLSPNRTSANITRSLCFENCSNVAGENETMKVAGKNETLNETASQSETDETTEERYHVQVTKPDGSINGDYVVLDHSTGSLSGVRYEAVDGADQELIQKALLSFLSLDPRLDPRVKLNDGELHPTAEEESVISISESNQQHQDPVSITKPEPKLQDQT